MAFHTFELSCLLDGRNYNNDYNEVKEALHNAGCKNYKDKKEYIPTHVFEVYKGLSIYLKKIKQGDYTHNMLYYRINPRRIMNDNDYVGLFNAEDSNQMLQRVDKILKDIHKGMPLVDDCNLSRIDFCCNALLESPDEVDFYIKLLNRGMSNDKYEIKKYKDKIAKRNILSKNGITYIGKNDVNIVFYNKKREMKQQNLPCSEIDYLNKIIRIEIQCNKEKVKRICRQYNIKSVREFLNNSDDIGISIFQKYACLFCGSGDFYKEKSLIKIIESSTYKNKTKGLMKELVNLSAKHSSLDKAMKIFDEKYGDNKAYKMVSKFNELKISPVVIPRREEYNRLTGISSLIEYYYNRISY